MVRWCRKVEDLKLFTGDRYGDTKFSSEYVRQKVYIWSLERR